MLFLALALLAAPQVQFDKTVHDFGPILTTDGSRVCDFVLTNTGDIPVSILAVITTCGCTKVEWTRESIPAGGSGKISVTYANDEGPHPFDKTVSVYLSDTKKPVILHVRGIVKKPEK